jgi:small subunit ribosomal protein S16
MVKIRLKRLGRKKRPFYRIVVMDIRERRQGLPLEELGYYNPLSRELKFDKQSAATWIGKGAIPTEAVARLIKAAPDSGELIVLERAQKERLSQKAVARQKAAEEAKAKPAAEATVKPEVAKVEAAHTKVEAAHTKVEAARTEVEAAHSEVEAAHTEVEAAHAEVEAAHAEVEAAHAEVEAAHTEVEAAHAEVEAAHAEVEAAHTEETVTTEPTEEVES